MGDGIVLSVSARKGSAVILSVPDDKRTSIALTANGEKKAYAILNPTRGLQGQIGPSGPPGPPGPPSDYLEFAQVSPSTEWIVNHNFGKIPIIQVISPGGIMVETEIFHQSENQTRIYFNTPQTGKAIAR